MRRMTDSTSEIDSSRTAMPQIKILLDERESQGH
jgi:hypothetical protein